MATIKSMYSSKKNIIVDNSVEPDDDIVDYIDEETGLVYDSLIDKNQSTDIINIDLSGHNPINTNGSLNLYRTILEDEKSRDKFIKEIVSQCRRAYEYRSYVHYLKEHVNLDSCTILKNIPIDKIDKVGLELHHFPLSLFDVVSIILADAMIKADDDTTLERFSTLTLVHKTLLAHWNNRIGLVPLTTTLHQMAHDGQLFIHPYSIFGDWLSFIEEYHSVIKNTEWLSFIPEKLSAIVNSWGNVEYNMNINTEKLAIGLSYNNQIIGIENLFSSITVDADN